MILQRLEALIECPLSKSQYKVPMILPSGNTVEESFLEVLIKDMSNDPYDRTKIWKDKIQNLFAKEIMELVNDIHELSPSLHQDKKGSAKNKELLKRKPKPKNQKWSGNKSKSKIKRSRKKVKGFNLSEEVSKKPKDSIDNTNQRKPKTNILIFEEIEDSEDQREEKLSIEPREIVEKEQSHEKNINQPFIQNEMEKISLDNHLPSPLNDDRPIEIENNEKVLEAEVKKPIKRGRPRKNEASNLPKMNKKRKLKKKASTFKSKEWGKKRERNEDWIIPLDNILESVNWFPFQNDNISINQDIMDINKN